jgi:N-acetylmuramoyl-L-alanine amidase
MRILIDNGHGVNTAGKRSPDGRYREGIWAREIAQYIVNELTARGYDAKRIVTEDADVSLSERVARVNSICLQQGAANVLLVSIHSNASGNGQWMPARGWSAFTSRGQTKADVLADYLYAEAKKNFVGHRVRTDYSDGDADWEEGFYILAKTKCAAVLTENFFHDNQDDVSYVTSEAGKQAVVNTHVDGIIAFVKAQHG